MYLRSCPWSVTGTCPYLAPTMYILQASRTCIISLDSCLHSIALPPESYASRWGMVTAMNLLFCNVLLTRQWLGHVESSLVKSLPSISSAPSISCHLTQFYLSWCLAPRADMVLGLTAAIFGMIPFIITNVEENFVVYLCHAPPLASSLPTPPYCSAHRGALPWANLCFDQHTGIKWHTVSAVVFFFIFALYMLRITLHCFLLRLCLAREDTVCRAVEGANIASSGGLGDFTRRTSVVSPSLRSVQVTSSGVR